MRWVLGILAFAVVTLVSPNPSYGQDDDWSRIVTSKPGAIMIEPPVLVVAPNVIAASWSPDGRYILTVHRQRGAGASSPTYRITRFDVARQAASELWKWAPVEGGEPDAAAIQWFVGSCIALVTFERAEDLSVAGGGPAIRVDAERQSARIITTLSPGETLALCPVRPIGIIHGMSEPDVNPGWTSMRTITQSGSVSGVSSLPGKWFPASWAPEGPVVNCMRWPESASGMVGREWCALHLDTMRMEPLAARPEKSLPLWQLEHGIPAVRVEDLDGTEMRRSSWSVIEEDVTVGDVYPPARVKCVWLSGDPKSERPKAFLTAHADRAHLAPGGRAVRFESNGALWVSALRHLTAEEFAAAKNSYLRTTTITNGKRIIAALMMFAQDNDGKYPDTTNERELQEALSPYLNDKRAFFDRDGHYAFTFLLRGQSMDAIDEPAVTELGYLSGPGGVAVLYADGHVVWRPTPK